MGVKLEDVIKQATLPSAHDHSVFFAEGFVTRDTTEGFFRIYPDATNKHRYAILRIEDVVGELHKFTEIELANSGLK
jgi:hypothetical protein